MSYGHAKLSPAREACWVPIRGLPGPGCREATAGPCGVPRKPFAEIAIGPAVDRRHRTEAAASTAVAPD
jgi:hypothetical protein